MQPNGSAFVSGEGVRLALTPAGLGSRTIAAAIDAAIEVVALIVLVVADVPLAGSGDDAGITALVLVELVAVIAGYPIVMEWTSRGRTLGKLVMGLRVVRDDGGPIGFRQALVRGLAGLVLEKPGLLFPLSTIAGLLTLAASSREKRIGDMMAGTVVLNERAAADRPVPTTTWIPPELQPWTAALDLHRLDDTLALRLRQFVSRATAMSPAAQYQLGEDLRRRVFAVVTPEPPGGTPTPWVLTAVLAERRRRATWNPQPIMQQPGRQRFAARPPSPRGGPQGGYPQAEYPQDEYPQDEYPQGEYPPRRQDRPDSGFPPPS